MIRKLIEINQKYQIKLVCETIFADLVVVGSKRILKIEAINYFRQVFYAEAKKIGRWYSLKKSKEGENLYIVKLEYIRLVEDVLKTDHFYKVELPFGKRNYENAKLAVDELKESQMCYCTCNDAKEMERYLILLGNNMTPKRRYSVTYDKLNNEDVIIRRIK